MQHIDAAKVLGSKVTIGLMRGLGSLETMDRDLADLSEAMKPLVAYADQKGSPSAWRQLTDTRQPSSIQQKPPWILL